MDLLSLGREVSQRSGQFIQVPTADEVPSGQSPATVSPSINIEPQRMLRRVSTSLPIAHKPLKISLRLPAIVTSSTGYWI